MTIKLELEVDETNLILEALGTLPFVRVYQLIGRIQAQARTQMQSEDPAESPMESKAP